MSDIAFGLLVDDIKLISATELADELEDAADGEEWAWVLWELNHAYFAIIKGSMRLKGRASQIEDVTVVSLGEAIDESEDSRAKWLIPAKSSSGSVHELAQKKIRNFVAEVYGMTLKEEDGTPFVKPKERVLAPISTRRKFTGKVPGDVKKPMGGSILGGSENTGSYHKPDETTTTPQPTAANGVIARKSRRGN